MASILDYSFLITAETRKELDEKIFAKCQKLKLTEKSFIIQRVHKKFNMLYDLDEEEFPEEGIINIKFR